jgi:hypothetical protein
VFEEDVFDAPEAPGCESGDFRFAYRWILGLICVERGDEISTTHPKTYWSGILQGPSWERRR